MNTLKLTYKMPYKQYAALCAPKSKGGCGLSGKREVIQYLNETAGLRGEIIALHID